MLTWALIFAVIPLVAGVFGFGGVAGTALGFAITYGRKRYKIHRSPDRFKELRPKIDAYNAR